MSANQPALSDEQLPNESSDLVLPSEHDETPASPLPDTAATNGATGDEGDPLLEASAFLFAGQPSDTPPDSGDFQDASGDSGEAAPEGALPPSPVEEETATALETAMFEAAETAEAVSATPPLETPDEEPAAAGLPEAEAAGVADFALPQVEPEPRREDLPFHRGDIVEGLVVQTTPTEVLIDIDGKALGVVSGRELERMDRRALEELQEGRTVLAYVLHPLDHQGHAVLSLSRALEERDWRRAQEFQESQEVYEGKVSGYNRGGLIVRFGRVRGFVPASQVSQSRLARAVGDSPQERWGGMVGEDVTVKVIEVDRRRNRLILSEKAAAKDWRDQRKAELLDELEVGVVRKGTVVSLTDFGAFVNLGGADGLIHLTELSWKHVTHPREVLQVGEQVEVKVISLDRRRRRIGLSLKDREPDPWEEVVARFRVGQLVRGRITKLTKFGAFACLVNAPEIEGLIHISELADQRVAHPREVVNEGEELTLRIVKIDKAQRRMGLSLKQVDAAQYLELDLASYDSVNDQLPMLNDTPEDENGDAGEDEMT